jgi:ribosome-associated protein
MRSGLLAKGAIIAVSYGHINIRHTLTVMNSNNKDRGENEPLHIHLGDDEDEHDDGGVEVIRPHARKTDSSSTRGRGLRNQPVELEEEEELPPSKTKIKKQMHELRDLGKELTELGKDQLAQLDIPENLRDALREMKSINKFGAQRRQIQYIGKLMRDVDPAPILAKLDAWKGKSQHHVAYMHQLERWRDRLLESDAALTELLSAHPQADAQRLRTLIRNAQKEMEAQKPPKNFREIFQVLREIIPEPT